MRLSRLHIGLYKAAMQADRDFATNGEKPYFFFSSFMGFIEYLILINDNRRGRSLPPGWSPYEMNVLLGDKGEILCLGQLRFGDADGNATWAGHIGYTVPPSLRGRGYAKEFLRRSLARAWLLGFERVMLTCDLSNAPSKHVIESCGGVYAGKYTDSEYNKYQYWFYNPESAQNKEDSSCKSGQSSAFPTKRA